MDRFFRLSEYSKSFSTRARADEIADALARFCGSARRNDRVVIDFNDVDAISYSFLDQFISQIMPLIRQRTIAIDGWSPSLIGVIEKSLKHRSCSCPEASPSGQRILTCSLTLA